MTDRRSLRIALLAPPLKPVPPTAYAGTERVVAVLAEELRGRGHQVTVFAAADSRVPGELVPTVPRSLWSTGYREDPAAYFTITLARAWQQHARFDVIHSHVETLGFLFARHCPTPVLSTLHGRLDVAGIPDLLREFDDIPLVAVSESQRRWGLHSNWVGTIHHGMPLHRIPFGDRPGDYLAFVGRVVVEKGVVDAIEVARRTKLPLKIAAKVYEPREVKHFQEAVEPAIAEGVAEYLGELEPARRDPLYAGARATLMLGSWPEPFGLVTIESMAAGTPVIARRAGALPEIVEHGVTGFLVDDLHEAELAVGLVDQLDRARIRERALERFSPSRMTDEYEELYYRLIAERSGQRPRLVERRGA